MRMQVAAFLFGLILVFAGLLPVVFAGASFSSLPTNTSQGGASGCADIVESRASTMAHTLNFAAAILLAQNSGAFQSLVSSENWTFNSIYNAWSFDPSCNLTWDSVNVVFSISSASGYGGNVVVTERNDLASIIKVTTQTGTSPFSTTQNQDLWAGYQFQSAAGYTSNRINLAYGNFQVPSVSPPWWGACWSPWDCRIGVWVGLSDQPGGYQPSCGTQSRPACIAQTGAESKVYCAFFGCTTSYRAWYEWYPSDPVYCDQVPTSPGNTIEAKVYTGHDPVNGGGDPNDYSLIVLNDANGKFCSSDKYWTAMGTPYNAQFMVEHVHSGTLPQFSRVTLYGSMVYPPGPTHVNIQTPWLNLWFDQYNLWSGGVHNAYVGGVDSSGHFNVDWSDSHGT